MKKIFISCLGLFVLFSFSCHGGETLTDPQFEERIKVIVLIKEGLIHQIEGEYEDAFLSYNKAIELDPKYTKAYFNRGSVYHYLGQYQKAIDDYTKVIELDPKDTNAYNNRGVVYDDSGEYQKAIDDYTKAIELDPTENRIIP